MRAWRRGDMRRTLQLLTRPGATVAQRLLAARAATALGRPDAAYTMLGEVRPGGHRALLELIRSGAAEALGQLELAAAHARAAGWMGAFALARLARLRGELAEAERRLDALAGHPLAPLERALCQSDRRLARAAARRLEGDELVLARAIAHLGEPLALSGLARASRPHLAPALSALAGEAHDRDALSALERRHRRELRRAAFDLFALASRASERAAAIPRVARDGSWLHLADGRRVSLRRRPRVKRVLATLAAHPRGIDPAGLFDRVWEEPRPRDAVLRNRVDVTLARLRATGLTDHVERRSGLVRLVGVEVAEVGQ